MSENEGQIPGIEEPKGASREAQALGVAPSGAGAKSRLPGQIFLFGFVIVGSVAAIYGMRQFGTRSGINFEQVKIDFEIDGAPADRTEDHARLKRVLDASKEPVQVPIDTVQKNPFLLKAFGNPHADVGGGPAVDQTAEIIRKMEEERKRRLAMIEDRLAELELHSVVLGSVPVARINEDVYRVGDLIEDLIEVTAIDGRSVTVTADGRSRVLTVGEENEPARPASKRRR